MAEDPLGAVHSYVERAYIRLQAGDLLLHCLEEGNLSSLQQLVESLVLAGPQNIITLQEILAETAQRRTQILDDYHQVLAEFKKSLKELGINPSGLQELDQIEQITAMQFLGMLRQQDIHDEKIQIACLQRLQETKEMISGLTDHIRLLAEIEKYLRDWLWGLAYQSTQEAPDDQPIHH